ncbi:MAG TPA: SDR family oxidoreductase [Acidiphilium sp.]|jgi:NAD(P)-dependent dehydrogenase (short-subunit alcohol dehydrogenase family)|uniref:SDR family oxidoreductase n=1 Tax=unclassified Acidiphilium TaxID=2617493 RepID=UPI000BDA8043|nr:MULTISPECIES: SDR family oxidoreductase [unclassified Acidiphilium]OYV56756.1 MAG: 3-oxoacyl-ACP reductase [Acidiphilium sp. 20-67-58]HQT60352.1 SDR family oxidoreductase [Acidiphilium sp.]HQU11973.1 SDR family oxidoreductase [Acidiphilium sp.]
MDLALSGKRVLVTGGSKGIGFACAAAFIAEGAEVAICSRQQANLDAAKATLRVGAAFATDLSDPGQAGDMVAAAEAELGPIDILVNSAGAARRTPPDELTPAHWRAAMDAKYFSYINVIDPLVKLMAARGRGVIVNVIGNGGKIASPVHLAGGAANAALMLATAGLATAYAKQGVRVVGLNPGLTETGRVAEGLASDARLAGISIDEARARGIARIPLGRMATPEEIANTVLFLASPRASYVTGVNITMDGAGTACVV